LLFLLKPCLAIHLCNKGIHCPHRSMKCNAGVLSSTSVN
jgi:hypothetical protein